MKYIIANWKMNLNTKEIYKFLSMLTQSKLQSKVVICPPFPYLAYAQHLSLLSDYVVGAQNCSEFANGSFTGEVSASMLQDIGCEYVIIGHSERRAIFKETETQFAEKINRASESDLKIIFCVGENLEQFNTDHTIQTIEHQLAPIENRTNKDNLIIAYEPVWSIGTGLIPTRSHIEKITKHIKSIINTPVVYGGSVNATNIHDLAVICSLDGFLVGGASLDVSTFKGIVEAVEATKSAQ